MRNRPMTVKVARWSALHPWRAMALWVVFVVAAIAVGGAVGPKEAESGGAVGETARAEKIVNDAGFPDQPGVEHVLITSRSGRLDMTEAQEAATDAADRMGALPGVSDVQGPVPSPDGSALILAVTMEGDSETAQDRVQPLLDATAAVQDDYPDLRVEEVGLPSIFKAIDEKVGEDFQRAEMFSLPITLIILLVAFGALIAAGVPVLLAISAVGSAIGLNTIASHIVPMQEATNSVILLIGMAVGVDYSLFYLKREREERARGAGHLDAVEIAAATSGHAVVVSGTAVIIAMAGMFLASDNIFSSFAVGTILVVAVSVLGSLTVLPALLAKLGRWVDRPRVPFVWRLTAARSAGDGAAARPRVWSAILRPALRKPLIALLVSAGALVALAIPALGMQLKLSGSQDIPRSIPVVQAYDRMTHAFPSTSGEPHVVVVKAKPEQADEVQAALDDLTQQAMADPLFAHDQPPEVTRSPNGTVTTLSIATPHITGTPEATASLDRLRDDLLPETVGQIDDVEFAVSGSIAGNTDYSAHIKDKLPLVVGFVLLLTFLVMAWTFRSIVVAMTAVVLNMLSVAAAYGVLVLVFQRTWAEGLLDFNSNQHVISWVPLFLFVVLFGLSMDYHVFVVSRIKEAMKSGMPNRAAVAEGITRSAGVVTSAAVVMVAVFALFGGMSLTEMKQLGVGLATAILIDATVIRAVLLPSVMSLLGPANWWAPRFMRDRTPKPAAGGAVPVPELVGAEGH